MSKPVFTCAICENEVETCGDFVLGMPFNNTTPAKRICHNCLDYVYKHTTDVHRCFIQTMRSLAACSEKTAIVREVMPDYSELENVLFPSDNEQKE